MRKLLSSAVVPFMAVALIPAASSATSHCKDVFIFSGPSAVVANAASPGFNLGAVGCNRESLNVSTNYLTPQADALRVGTTGTEEQKPTNGTVRFGNGDPISLTFTFEPVRGRWLSQVVTIPAGTQTVKAQARAWNSNSAALVEQSIVYTKFPV